MTTRLTFRSTFEGAKVDGNILRGVHIIGFESKNGYSYLPEAVERAAPLYEAKPVYEEHSKNRKVSDILGVFENVKFVPTVGNVGDFKMNPKHFHYEQFKWMADNTPDLLGMSHSASIAVNESKKLVMDIKDVESVDMVATPATVEGLYAKVTEGIVQDRIDKDTEAHKLHTLVYAGHSLSNEVLWGEGTDGEKSKKLRKIHSDLASELKNHFGEDAKESVNMDRATLSKEHPEIVEAIRNEAITAERKIQESLNKVAEPLRTAVFESQLRKCTTDAEVEALIADRASLGVVVKTAAEQVIAKAATETKVTTVTEQTAKPITYESTFALAGHTVTKKA